MTYYLISMIDQELIDFATEEELIDFLRDVSEEEANGYTLIRGEEIKYNVEVTRTITVG